MDNLCERVQNPPMYYDIQQLKSRRMMKIKDITRHLNISESTLSRSLSNHPRLSDNEENSIFGGEKNSIADQISLQKVKSEEHENHWPHHLR